MATTAVSSTTQAPLSTATSTADRMKSADFFKLLVTELQQQDPLEPTKTGDMISQVSQIRNIEVSQQLMTTLDQLTKQQRTAGASELLGKYVEATVAAADGTQSAVSGVVTGVRFGSDGVAVLELDSGQTVRATDVTRVSASAPVSSATATTSAAKDAAAKTAAAAPAGTATPTKPIWLQGGFQL